MSWEHYLKSTLKKGVVYMAKKKDEKEMTSINKRFSKGISGVTSILNKLSTSLYGTDMVDESDKLNERFNEIMKDSINNLTGNGSNDYNSFLGKLYEDDRHSSSAIQSINRDIARGGVSSIVPAEFITEKYKNRLLKLEDCNRISEQLVELREAKHTMLDAIVSTDINEGRINRNITFKNSTVNDPAEEYMETIKAVEERFEIQSKTKEVTDKLLGYGEYNIYTIGYDEIFNQFSKKYKGTTNQKGIHYYESADASYGIVEDIKERPLCENDRELKSFFESGEDILKNPSITASQKELEKELTELSDRITVCTDHIPIPILENGFDTMVQFGNEYITEDGCHVKEEYRDLFLEEGKKKSRKSTKKSDNQMLTDEDVYLRKYNGGVDDGFYSDKGKDEEDFSDIKDAYVKLIPPTELLPVKVMGQTLFYIYIHSEDMTPLEIVNSYTNMQKEKGSTLRIDSLVDDIVERIVQKFDKKFVVENKEFRKLIVAALNHYDMGTQKIHFQVIPKEYITSFKIDKDEDGNGHSMIEPSLFYAKSWLMMFMFFLVSYITKSNDQQINYIRTSGIDKNIFNKAQQIAREKQARRITLNDMFSYTGVINKVASGSEIYMPLGRNGEKPIESEILQGQDVSINNEIMENLRTNYILGSGVPSAIINYLNEADFAKSIETANTKMNGRVVNYQLDINPSLTDWYRKLLRITTTIPEEVINSIVVTLSPPKGSSNITSQELINNYGTLEQFILKLYFGESPDPEDQRVRNFQMEVAKMHLPMLNFQELDAAYDKVTMENVKDEIAKPKQEEDYENM